MKLRKQGDVFVLDSSYEERATAKAAGFWWHPGRGKCDRRRCQACAAGVGASWWTRDVATAARLVEHADDEARAALGAVAARVEASRAADADVEIPAPEGQAYLPFQKAGIAYSMQRSRTLLADEMGLGKTIQALGVVNATPAIRSVLVVCPATLRLNWKREATRWLVRPFAMHVVGLDDGSVPTEGDRLVVVNYERVKGKTGAALMAQQWDLLVVDECHYAKSGRKAQRAVAVLGAAARRGKPKIDGLADRADRLLLLTGTPILNRPVEAQPLLAACDPAFGGFGFLRRYCDAQQTKWGWTFDGATHLDELQQKARASCMVRRLKADVLTELPAKRRQIVEVALNGAAGAVAAESRAWDAHEDALAGLQAAADLAHASGDAGAYEAAVARLRDEAQAAFTEMARLRHATAVAKIPAAVAHCVDVLDGGDGKLVVWAHHHDVVDALAEGLTEYGVVVLTGETPQAARQGVVDRFQEDPKIRVFIGGITAAGVGITLTAASHAVFVELSWVPSEITQCEDREHRIGQTNPVLVQHLVLDESLDARMAKVLVAKQDIADRALDRMPELHVPAIPDGRSGAPREPRPRTYPVATEEQRDAALRVVRILAGMCDGARTLDGAGFSKYDVHIGHELAMCERLTDGQAWIAARMATKYRRQLPPDLVVAAGGKKVE